jgi:type I restriction enzyme M protein
MLTAAEERIRELNPGATVRLYGQEPNGESFGVCRSDMVIKGQEPDNIAFGNTLSDDRFKGERFHRMLSNPPFGVDWKKVEDEVREEADKLGMKGRFGAGLPADQRRPASVPAAHAGQDAYRRRHAPRHRHERLAAVHRRRRLG